MRTNAHLLPATVMATGAVVSVAWSHDGSTLLSAGEDGEVKIWSRR